MDVVLLAGALLTQPVAEPPPESAEPSPEATAAGPDAAVPDAAEPPASGVDEAPTPETPPSETFGNPESTPAQTEPVDFANAEPPGEVSPATTDPFVSTPAPPVERASDDEPPPFETRREQPTGARPRPEYQRGGTFISLSAGAGQCGVWCSFVPMIGGGRFEAGYRWGYIALGGSISLLGANFDTPNDDSTVYYTVEAKGSTRFFHIGPVLQFFPAQEGRFDPYVTLGFGFRHLVDVADVEGVDGEVKYWERGAAVTIGGGIPFFVRERLSLGLRYDKMFALGGSQCITIGGNAVEDQDRCQSHAKLTGDYNEVENRADRTTRPRPWTVSLEMRISF